MSIFEHDFDMKEYIDKRALTIEDLTSRKLFKDVMRNIFLALNNETAEKYHELEKKVIAEVLPPHNGPDIITNIVTNTSYDVTDEFLRPVRMEDLDKKELSMADIADKMQGNGNCYVKTIFLAADYDCVNRFGGDEQYFCGKIHTNHGEFTAKFAVKRNTYYQSMVEKFYSIFQLNFYSWRTVCMPYFLKLFDVYLISAENLDFDDELVDIKIDFAEFTGLVKDNQIPLWNVESTSLKTSTYPEPCIDKINYEHRIFAHRFAPKHHYLVANTDIRVTNMRWENGDLLITCPKQDPVKWDMYCFRELDDSQIYENPTMTNSLKNTFSARLYSRYNTRVRTKIEIARLLGEFVVDDLQFKDLRIVNNDFAKETYDVNAFMEDEIRIGNWQEALLLDFFAKDDRSYLNHDIMSFFVSTLQEAFPEYECCGRLVKR